VAPRSPQYHREVDSLDTTTSCPSCSKQLVVDFSKRTLDCPDCGEVKPPDLDFRSRALLKAASSVLHGRPSASRSQEAVTDIVDHENAVEIRAEDDGERPIALLGPLKETGDLALGPVVDPVGLGQFVGQLPTAAVAGLLASQVAGQVVLRIPADLQAMIQAGTATFMTAADGALRGNIVNAASGAVIGQASFVPASVATAGVAGAWYLLSVLVAQKHLADINSRLDRLEKKVDEIRRLQDDDIFGEIRGDAEHLMSLGRAHMASPLDAAKSPELHQTLDGIVRSCRHRKQQLEARVGESLKTLDAARGARYFGRTLGRATNELTDDVESTFRQLQGIRLNTLVFMAAAELRRALKGRDSIGEQYEQDADSWGDWTDERARELVSRLETSLYSLEGTKFRRRSTEADSRAAVAAIAARGLELDLLLRRETESLRVARSPQPATFRLQLDKSHKVTEARAVLAV